MNAAARAINESTLFSGQLFEMRLSKQLWIVLFLLSVVLINALTVVYITNEHRSSYGQLQQLDQQRHSLQMQWGQLLLEQASLATPARVEQLAKEKLKMRLPVDKHMFVLQAR